MSALRVTRIAILGGGFGGTHVARELARLLPEHHQADIILVDRQNFFVFTPMLTEVAGGEVPSHHIVIPNRRLSPRVKFVQGRVDGVDVQQKRVTLTVGGDGAATPERSETLEADHLVIALGSVTNYHHLDGVQEHSLAIKNLGDAAAIHSRAISLLERAAVEPDPNLRRQLLTFVVAGGGFSGVETMAALNALVRDSLKRYPSLSEHELRTVLAHPGEHLLQEIGPKLGDYAQQKLEQNGVEVRIKTEINGAGDGYVELKGGERITTHLLVWTAGVKPSPVIGVLDVKRGQHGGVVVEPTCAVAGHTGLWALGDCAELPEQGGKKTYAPTAQNATREGNLVARNIVRALHGQPLRPFTYQPIGQLALVGRHSGVGSLAGLHFSGLVAWALWRGVYLAKEPRMEQRVHVAVDWLMDLLFGVEIAALPGKGSEA